MIKCIVIVGIMLRTGIMNLITEKLTSTSGSDRIRNPKKSNKGKKN